MIMGKSYRSNYPNFEERAREGAERFLKSFSLESLTPDASTRRYFRARKGEDTIILMVMGKLDKKIVFEEILETTEKFEEPTFLNIGRFLEKAGVKIPKVFEYYEDIKVIVLEDFGNKILEDFYKENFEKSILLYEDAIDQLVKMQTAEPDPECYAFKLRFTEGMFMWEFDHFIEYGMEPSSELEVLKGVFLEVSERLARLSETFCHRDYHSRNLMVLGKEVGIIDFQDALLAPRQYDLASLLRDAYVDLPSDFEEYLVSRYIQAMKENRIYFDEEEFIRVFNIQAIQRNLKAAGRFVYIFKEKGNPKFLKYVGSVMIKALKAMEREPIFKHVIDIIAKNTKWI